MRLFREDRPRQHHYQFAHRELLGASRRVAASLPGLARSGRLDLVLVQAWSRLGEAMPADSRLPAEGLASSLHSFQDRDIVLVTMPSAEHAAEVHFAAIVISGDRLTDYYVLEHRWTTEDEPRTVMCKWDERGHVNFGDGPPAEAGAFLAAVEQVRCLRAQNRG
jgi:hypothetical protein